jgi:hypothetical protein
MQGYKSTATASTHAHFQAGNDYNKQICGRPDFGKPFCDECIKDSLLAEPSGEIRIVSGLIKSCTKPRIPCINVLWTV